MHETTDFSSFHFTCIFHILSDLSLRLIRKVETRPAFLPHPDMLWQWFPMSQSWVCRRDEKHRLPSVMERIMHAVSSFSLWLVFTFFLSLFDELLPEFLHHRVTLSRFAKPGFSLSSQYMPFVSHTSCPEESLAFLRSRRHHCLTCMQENVKLRESFKIRDFYRLFHHLTLATLKG